MAPNQVISIAAAKLFGRSKIARLGVVITFVGVVIFLLGFCIFAINNEGFENAITEIDDWVWTAFTLSQYRTLSRSLCVYGLITAGAGAFISLTYERAIAPIVRWIMNGT